MAIRFFTLFFFPKVINSPFIVGKCRYFNRLIKIFLAGFCKLKTLVLYLQSEKNRKYRLKTMANHKSALKRIRANATKRLRNRYQAKTTRTFIKRLRAAEDKKSGQELLPKVISMLDRLAKKNIIHKNKAANNKSKLTKFVNGLS